MESIQVAISAVGPDPIEEGKCRRATARECRVLPIGECLDSCLKFVEDAKGRGLKQQIEVQAAGTPSRGSPSTPVATARPEEEAGSNIEELGGALRPDVDQLRRERDVWFGEHQLDTNKGSNEVP